MTKLEKARKVLEYKGFTHNFEEDVLVLFDNIDMRSGEVMANRWRIWSQNILQPKLFEAVARIYERYFSDSELDAIIAFYKDNIDLPEELMQRVDAIAMEFAGQVGEAFQKIIDDFPPPL